VADEGRGLNPEERERIAAEIQSAIERRPFGSMRVMIISVDGPVAVLADSFAEVQRASRFDNDVNALLEGRLEPARFDRRWAGRTIAEVPLPDAEQVLYLGLVGEATFDDFYPERVLQ
jgi:hypothetical protein